MTDPMDKLSAAMRAAPQPTAKARAADRAMQAFEKEFQETAAPARPTLQTQPIWSRMMSLLTRNLRPALMGGTSLAALSLALIVAVNVGEESSAPAPGAIPAPPEKALVANPAPAVQEQAEVAIEHPPVVPVPGAVPLAENDGAAGALSRKALAVPAPLRMEAPTPLQNRAVSIPAPADLIMPMPIPLPEGGYAEGPGNDRFANEAPNPVKLASEEPVSTFSIDVDTASYAWARRNLREGRLPTADSVRVEEMINYFSYEYPKPEGDAPFSISTTLMEAPWAEGRKLLIVGLRAAEPEVRPRANLTFLIDTSGSMHNEDKLPLLVTSLRLMLDELRGDDTVSIVTYAGSSTTALEPTPVSERGRILDALDGLQAGGGTAGAAGIETAYRLAEESFDADAVNRVILATDGDFNIGPASAEEMEALIAKKRETGVFLSVFGFGRGNLNDGLMQTLAQAGNGQAAYIDTLAEGRAALAGGLMAMVPVAGDVKAQIEFNPATVQDWRLIGYETRALAREDFNNDRVDAGEMGAGHRVTAIYEITPVGGPARIDDLRYQSPTAAVAEGGGASDELAFLRLRWKAPGSDESQLRELPIGTETVDPDPEARFAAAVAGFGQLLRGTPHLGTWSWDGALALAESARGADPLGQRAEFLDLLRLARSLDR